MDWLRTPVRFIAHSLLNWNSPTPSSDPVRTTVAAMPFNSQGHSKLTLSFPKSPSVDPHKGKKTTSTGPLSLDYEKMVPVFGCSDLVPEHRVASKAADILDDLLSLKGKDSRPFSREMVFYFSNCRNRTH